MDDTQTNATTFDADSVMDEKARTHILFELTSNIKLEGAFDLAEISRATSGFVKDDLEALVTKAGKCAMRRILEERKLDLSRESTHTEQNEDWWRKAWTSEELEMLGIKMCDFEAAAKLVQPFSSIPNVKWEDVVGLDKLKREFDLYIVKRIKYPDVYEEDGCDLKTAFLLFGSPGCGKTLIAKAVANEAGANFKHIKGPELLSKSFDENELALRTIFSRARTCSPCILFFDEVDFWTARHEKEGGRVLLNQLLIELDGGNRRDGVYVIGSTNSPELMDSAILGRKGFGKHFYVPLPTQEEHGLILRALAKKIARKRQIDADVDLVAIAHDEACRNLSGADLSELMTHAALEAAFEEKFSKNEEVSAPHTIKAIHFQQALGRISPSIFNTKREYYHQLSTKGIMNVEHREIVLLH